MENNIPNINIPEPKNDLQYAMATIGLISIAGGVAIGKTNPVIGGAICLAGVAGVTVICFKALEDISSKRRAEHEAQRLLAGTRADPGSGFRSASSFLCPLKYIVKKIEKQLDKGKKEE